jgi:DNA-binding IclR family transcriptional regulator
MTRSSPDYTIAVVDRALDVLEALAAADGPVGVSEIARSIHSTKSAVYRILATLERRGYIVRDGPAVHYHLGTRLTYLGQRALEGLDLRQRARPFLEELHRAFNETVNLGVLDGIEIAYIDMVESDYGLRMAAELGSRDPAYSTSLGKAILAFLPPDEVSKHLPSLLLPRTSRTITDLTTLLRELERIRNSGVAEDRGENEDGARCFGAPILDHRGYPIAAISVAAPESRLDDRRSADVVQAVKATASDITQRIGGRQPEAAATA